VLLSYKYRIYPNVLQEHTLWAVFVFCRQLYNAALEERISSWKHLRKSVSYFDQVKSIKGIKKTDLITSQIIYSQVLQQVLKQVDIAFQNFFRRLKNGDKKSGFPRFKKNTKRFNSILFPQCDFDVGGIRLSNDQKHITIFGIPGLVKIKYHRPYEGRCKNVRIVREGFKWFVVLTCDDVPQKALSSTGKTIGIDLGISTFVTTSDNIHHHHPKAYKTSKETLAARQRKLATKQKGSKNYRKASKSVRETHEHLTNIRHEYQHDLANKLVDQNDTIVIEKLNIVSMLEAKGFDVKNENITDASWGSFAAKLKYKAERAGRSVIEVNPRNTSKTCSGCGTIKKSMPLNSRTFCCDKCNLSLDRDHNAALNILRLGLSHAAPPSLKSPNVGTGHSKIMPFKTLITLWNDSQSYS